MQSHMILFRAALVNNRKTTFSCVTQQAVADELVRDIMDKLAKRQMQSRAVRRRAVQSGR